MNRFENKYAVVTGGASGIGQAIAQRLGAWTRLFSDAFGQIGLLDFKNPVSRGKFITGLAFSLPVIWSVTFLFYRDPTFMIIVGGIATTLILFIVAFAAGWMRYRELPAELTPGKAYDVFLWLSLAAIAGVGFYVAVRTVGPMMG